jgi:hypothetical protein
MRTGRRDGALVGAAKGYESVYGGSEQLPCRTLCNVTATVIRMNEGGKNRAPILDWRTRSAGYRQQQPKFIASALAAVNLEHL